MLSRYDWEWSSAEVTPSLGQPYELDAEADMEIVPVRRGGSCDPILLALEGSCKVKVTGPPGCGKSSAYVSALARATARPIVHLVPHPRLVEDFTSRGYDGCTISTDVGVVLCSPVVIKCPIVVVTTYTRFLARSMEMGKSLIDVSRRPIFYCDECHESDAATYSVVRMFKSRADYHNVIFVSATLDGDEAVLETGGVIADRSVDFGKDTASFTRSVVESLKSNPDARITLVYSDPGFADLEVLKKAVVSLGYSWFRLTSRATLHEYAQVKVASRTDKVVLCVDSSYRSGFDLPVAMVIDSGMISYRSSRDPSRRTLRRAFGFELYQARGRLGRNPLPYPCDLVYVRPKADASDYTVNVEGYEGIIAAHAIHSQGLALPSELRLIGIERESLYLPDYRLLDSCVNISKVELVSMRDIKAKRKERVSDDESEYGDVMAGFAALNLSKPVSVKVPEKIGRAMISVAGAVQDTGVGTDMFPFGKESVLQCISKTSITDLLTKIGRRDMYLVCSVVAEEMNNLSCEYLATDTLIKFVSREPEADRSADQVRWLREFRSAMALKTGEFKSRSLELQMLVDNAHVDFAVINPREFKDVITTIASTYVSVYKSLKNKWLSNDAIIDASRQRVLKSDAVNAGFDAAGRNLKAVDSGKNQRRLEELATKPQGTSSVAKSVAKRPEPRFPDYSVKEVTLTVMHGSLESVQSKYPNAVITPDAMRREYDSRSLRSGASGSSSRGSWSKRTYKDGPFKLTAKSWHPPG